MLVEVGTLNLIGCCMGSQLRVMSSSIMESYFFRLTMIEGRSALHIL